MNLNLILQLAILLISALLGYFFGVVKQFRENKQKTYFESLVPILKFSYDRQSIADEQEFNKAINALWLYSNKKVARKLRVALDVIHHPEKGDVTEKLQLLIGEMRKDIQIFHWQKLRSTDIDHFYTILNTLRN